jgi:predicted secreted protein
MASHKLGPVAVLLLLALHSTAASAGDPDPLTYDRISLSVSVREQVEADRLVAILVGQREGTDAAKLATEVNSLVSWALQTAKAEPRIEVETLDYTTNPLYTQGNLSGWRVRQQIRLRSRDSAALGELVGRLQERLLLQSIGYQVSDERRKEAQDALIRAGIDAFKARAQLIAGQMGQPRHRLVEMRIETAGDRPPPIVRGMAVSSAMAEADESPIAPRIEPGKQDIKVDINGVIELQVQ